MNGVDSVSFRAMGTDVEVLAAPVMPVEGVASVRARFTQMETRFSRFLPDSELSRVNASAGAPVFVSPVFREALLDAIAAAEASGGLFQPLILAAVEGAGYRRSFEEWDAEIQASPSYPSQSDHRDIALSDRGVVSIPPGAGLDLGGFAKGWTVDRCTELMPAAGSWVINAGGDLFAHGAGPEGEGWMVGIEDPFVPAGHLAVLRAADTAVATSSTMRRRWRTQDGFAHHLIDPRTGRPADSDVVSATVCAGTVAGAEVMAKQLLLLGKHAARRYADDNRIPCVLVDANGCLIVSDAMEALLVC
jgi:thiamine biosynthesis lipoprotein